LISRLSLHFTDQGKRKRDRSAKGLPLFRQTTADGALSTIGIIKLFQLDLKTQNRARDIDLMTLAPAVKCLHIKNVTTKLISI
jgi:hypothetical protein